MPRPEAGFEVPEPHRLVLVLPPDSVRKLVAFLTAKTTGQIIFNTNQGRIEGLDLRDCSRVVYSSDR